MIQFSVNQLISMKKLVLTLALAAVASFANAQGTIQIANNAQTRFRVCGAIPPNGNGGSYSFGLSVGLTPDAISSQLVGLLCTNSTTGGIISGPSPQAYQIPGYAPDSMVFLQIRGWESRFGVDWERSRREGLYGESEVRSVRLGPAGGPGTVVWSSTDLTKFQPIDLCPEPSTIALTGLGLGALLLFRRRRPGS
jgi:hypothetical protein